MSDRLSLQHLWLDMPPTEELPGHRALCAAASQHVSGCVTCLYLCKRAEAIEQVLPNLEERQEILRSRNRTIAKGRKGPGLDPVHVSTEAADRNAPMPGLQYCLSSNPLQLSRTCQCGLNYIDSAPHEQARGQVSIAMPHQGCHAPLPAKKALVSIAATDVRTIRTPTCSEARVLDCSMPGNSGKLHARLATDCMANADQISSQKSQHTSVSGQTAGCRR